MLRLSLAAALATVVTAATCMSTAQAYIGEGVQGRPHGGQTAVRMLYRRHGLPIPSKHRKRHHRRYNY